MTLVRNSIRQKQLRKVSPSTTKVNLWVIPSASKYLAVVLEYPNTLGNQELVSNVASWDTGLGTCFTFFLCL